MAAAARKKRESLCRPLPIALLTLLLVFLISILPSWIAYVTSDESYRGLHLPENWLYRLRMNKRWFSYEGFKEMQGVYVLSDKKSFACLLVLSDVCHVSGSVSSGAWYSMKDYDLSKIATSEDVCGHADKNLPDGFTSKSLANIKRIQGNMGLFLSKSPEKIPGYQALADKKTIRSIKEALISPHDPFPSHFVEAIGPLAEISLAVGSTFGNKFGAFFNLSFFFPTGNHDPRIAKNVPWIPTRDMKASFLKNIVRLLFGESVSIVGSIGRPENEHFCFKRVVFPLNIVHLRESTKTFRDSIYSYADGKVLNPSGPCPQPRRETQITWLWQSSRKKIINGGDVMDSIVRKFPGIRIVVLESRADEDFKFVVSTIRQTNLLIGMHGSGFSNIIFLQDNTTVFEIQPYLLEYNPFQKLCSINGINYHNWRNPNASNHFSDNGCFAEFSNYTASDCGRNLACRVCVRDHSNTFVDVADLDKKLSALKFKDRS